MGNNLKDNVAFYRIAFLSRQPENHMDTSIAVPDSI